MIGPSLPPPDRSDDRPKGAPHQSRAPRSNQTPTPSFNALLAEKGDATARGAASFEETGVFGNGRASDEAPRRRTLPVLAQPGTEARTERTDRAAPARVLPEHQAASTNPSSANSGRRPQFRPQFQNTLHTSHQESLSDPAASPRDLVNERELDPNGPEGHALGSLRRSASSFGASLSLRQSGEGLVVHVRVGAMSARERQNLREALIAVLRDHGFVKSRIVFEGEE